MSAFVWIRLITRPFSGFCFTSAEAWVHCLTAHGLRAVNEEILPLAPVVRRPPQAELVHLAPQVSGQLRGQRVRASLTSHNNVPRPSARGLTVTALHLTDELFSHVAWYRCCVPKSQYSGWPCQTRHRR